MKKQIYLDYAASTPVDPKVKKAMEKVADEAWANPSSGHSMGKKSREALEESRKRIAKVLGAKPAEIIFTSGSTEAANLAVLGVAKKHYNTRVVASAIEHESVLECLTALEGWGRFTGSIPVVSNGVIDPESVHAAIDDTTVLVCVMYANNEIGTIQPIAKIGQKIAEIRKDRAARGIITPLYLYCDAAQAGMLPLAVSRLGVDLMSMGGSKLYGPRGAGFLYVRTGVELEPIAYGGGQESNLRSGTENVIGSVGLAEALEAIQSGRQKEDSRQEKLRDELWAKIHKGIPEAILNGDKKSRLGGNLNILIPGISGETLVAYLDKDGFAVATGSACTESNEAPSHVLMAIGRAAEEARSSLRVTIGRQTTKSNLDEFAKTLVKSITRLRELGQK